MVLALLLIAIGLWWMAASLRQGPLEVTAFAVGDGDALLIRSPSGRTVLIDGGSRSQERVGERVLVPGLALLGVRRLDAIIITHSDSDHVNGLVDVLERFPVDRVLGPTEDVRDAAAFQRVMAVATAREIPRFPLTAGDIVNLDAETRLRVLAPARTPMQGTRSDDNNNAVVACLEYGKARMLFTGDIELEAERRLLAERADLDADILKVTHHGSRFGTSDAFLDSTTPTTAVISASGEQSHPHPEVLARLQQRGIRILRTDIGGRIRLFTRGEGWEVETYRR